MKHTIFLLWIFVVAASALECSGYRSSLEVLQIIQSIVAIIIIFIVPSLCIAHIVHTKRKVPLDMWEYINIASASSLVIVPLLLLAENILIGRLYAWLPFFNTILLLAAACYFGYKNMVLNVYEKIQPLWVFAFGIFGLIIVLISSAYSALPESDPYYWLQQYRSVIPTGIFHNRDRPLFYALSFLFVDAAHVDLYMYLKYLFPFLSIAAILPAALVARQYQSYALRLVVLSFPLFAPSTFLYSQIPFPQAISITLMYYFFFWLLYSIGKNDLFFYFAAGLISFLSFFYHEISAVLCMVWIIVTIMHYRNQIAESIRKNKLITILVILLVVSNSLVIKKIAIFIAYWAKYIVRNSKTINLHFPAEYINIDGNSVGWGNMLGVTKYYFYYVGPILLLAILYFLYLLISNKGYRKFIKTKITTHPEIQIISIIGVLFFTISEILPRIGGLALLPERMWTVGSIFVSILVLSLFEFHQKKYLIRNTSIILILVCVSIGAIFYVNNLKKYVLPDYQIKSAVWIKKNLPANRIILTNKHEILIQVHSESHIALIEDSLYCNSVVEDPAFLLATTRINKKDSSHRDDLLQRTAEHITSYLKAHKNVSIDDFTIFINQSISRLKSLDAQKAVNHASQGSVYVYYAKDDVRNPYLSRPYAKDRGTCEQPSFANYSNYYTEIYNDNGNVTIWEVKQ